MKRLAFFRHFSQMAVIALFCLLPWLNAKGMNEIGGSLFAFDIFGIPFADPASALQALAGSAAIGVFPMPALWGGALLALLLALCMGRIFCGWLCPYGFFSECVYNARRKISAGKGLGKAANSAYWGKACLLAAALLAMLFFGFPLVSLLSFPGDISLIPLLIWQGASGFLLISAFAAPAVVLVLEFVFRRRLWCRHMCPQSVLLGAAAWALPVSFPGLRVRWKAKDCVCGKASPCRAVCSLDLNPRRKGGPPRRDCLMCGACLQACASHGKALKWKISAK